MSKVKNNFDSVAWCYDFLAYIIFGNKIRRSQTVLFDQLCENDRVLILGGGTGWIINEILRSKKVARIDYIELSEKMLQKAKSIIPLHKDVVINFINGDEESIPGSETYDVVIACYFFDLFQTNRLKYVITRTVNSLKAEGKLLVADFNISSSSPLLHKVLVRIMYLFFSVTCRIEARGLIDMGTVLSDYDLSKEYSLSSCNGLIISTTYKKVLN